LQIAYKESLTRISKNKKRGGMGLREYWRSFVEKGAGKE
jgi:hypothetical protein